MIYGLIICAGKQSRFHSQTPKALVSINGKTLLGTNIKNMSPYCDKIFVVCSFENEHFFNYKNKIAINSGKGSGDAVWQALEFLNPQKDDTVFVMWGDSLQKPNIFEQMKIRYNGTALIPCRFEVSPYVQIKQKDDNHLQINFSKFNEKITPGYHDLSVFYSNAAQLLDKCREFRSKILTKDGNYAHKHGNEMEFLDIFNETDIAANIFDMKSYDDFSFNTIEQLTALKKKYN